METNQDSTLQRRLASYSALAAAGVCAAIAPTSADAAIVYSGAVNIPVPASATGNYINATTFAVGTTFASVNGGDATAPALNFWGTSASRVWFYPTSSTVDRFVSDASSNPLELTLGTLISAASVFGTTTEPTSLTPSGTSGVWTAGSTGYLGYKFLNGTTTEYGWALVSVPTGAPSTASPIRVLGLAYDNTGAGIAAGAVPEPGTVGALAFGALGVGALAWRRRKALV